MNQNFGDLRAALQMRPDELTLYGNHVSENLLACLHAEAPFR